MSARWLLALPLALALLGPGPSHAQKGVAAEIEAVRASGLPREAIDTIALIRKGGPYPYAKDHAVFGNREAKLPKRKRGYYREYTVKTPGERTRGARRIVAGGGRELYYTEDHYKTFRRIRENE